MSESPKQSIVVDSSDTLVVERRGPGKLKFYTVREDQLERLETGSDIEGLALAFLGMLFGASVSLVIALVTSPPSGAIAYAIFVVSTVFSLLLSVALFIAWLILRAGRKRELRLLRENASPPEVRQYVAR
jgi:hypothetical protein